MTELGTRALRLGTVWTAPGEGATVGQLYKRFNCVPMMDCNDKEHAPKHKLSRYINYAISTNLALTGHPLTNEDCTRILSERFRVGGSNATD